MLSLLITAYWANTNSCHWLKTNIEVNFGFQPDDGLVQFGLPSFWYSYLTLAICTSTRKLAPIWLTLTSLNMLAVCLHLLVKLHSWRAARSTCLFISASFWTFSRLFTAYLSLLIPAPSSMFSVLCISNRAFCLTLKAANVIFFSQLMCRNSDQSLGVFLPRWHQLPWRYNRLCLQWHRDPQYFPYPFRPGSIRVCQSAGGRWLTSATAPPPSADHSFRLPALHRQQLTWCLNRPGKNTARRGVIKPINMYSYYVERTDCLNLMFGILFIYVILLHKHVQLTSKSPYFYTVERKEADALRHTVREWTLLGCCVQKRPQICYFQTFDPNEIKCLIMEMQLLDPLLRCLRICIQAYL